MTMFDIPAADPLDPRPIKLPVTLDLTITGEVDIAKFMLANRHRLVEFAESGDVAPERIPSYLLGEYLQDAIDAWTASLKDDLGSLHVEQDLGWMLTDADGLAAIDAAEHPRYVRYIGD